MMNPIPMPGGRPTVLQVRIRDKQSLAASYMPAIRRGAIFVPTGRRFSLGDDVYVVLALPEESEQYPIAGRVVWLTPGGATGAKVPGIGVQFGDDTIGVQAKQSIDRMLAGVPPNTKGSYTF
jgi:type IV pilus assembly protein PilZ